MTSNKQSFKHIFLETFTLLSQYVRPLVSRANFIRICWCCWRWSFATSSWAFNKSGKSVSTLLLTESLIKKKDAFFKIDIKRNNIQIYQGGWFNKLKMQSYQYRKSHCGDKTILRPSYLHNGISYTGKMASLYWIGAQVCSGRSYRRWVSNRPGDDFLPSRHNELYGGEATNTVASVITFEM